MKKVHKIKECKPTPMIWGKGKIGNKAPKPTKTVKKIK